MKSYYLKFQIPFNIIRDHLSNFKRIVFHIDLASISRGFYNKDVVQLEITNYIDTRKPPTLFFEEAKQFLAKIYDQFRPSQYLESVKFNIFYDSGECLQNKTIYNGYKDRASGSSSLMLEDAELELYHEIKKYYYSEFENKFKIPNVCNVNFVQLYEADFMPWFMIVNNIWQCQEMDTLNVILSTDKDLLQCCQFGNCIQILTLYSKKESKIIFNVYNDLTAIAQIYPNYNRGTLTSRYIPTMLALSGDKADKIPGIPRVGEATAYKLIINHNLHHEILEHTKLPKELEEHRKLLIRNYKLISFDEQLKRVPLNVLTDLKNSFT